MKLPIHVMHSRSLYDPLCDPSNQLAVGMIWGQNSVPKLIYHLGVRLSRHSLLRFGGQIDKSSSVGDGHGLEVRDVVNPRDENGRGSSYEESRSFPVWNIGCILDVKASS